MLHRSKDLEDALESMGSGSAVLGNEISALGKTETDDDMKKLFNEIGACALMWDSIFGLLPCGLCLASVLSGAIAADAACS